MKNYLLSLLLIGISNFAQAGGYAKFPLTKKVSEIDNIIKAIEVPCDVELLIPKGSPEYTYFPNFLGMGTYNLCEFVFFHPEKVMIVRCKITSKEKFEAIANRIRNIIEWAEMGIIYHWQ